MGYDGGFTKIRIKIETQEILDNYEKKLRTPLYNTLGKDNFFKFETVAINLRYLDNDWSQVHCLRNVIDYKDIRNYENDDTEFTLITKDILKKYIVEIKKDYNEKLLEYGYDEENKFYQKDIQDLEQLYNDFDWDNNTLVFSYSY